MASYTDNPQITASFSPYVQQLPVEAMTRVGIQKQAQYDQGIQRVQAQIDNVAGLPVVKGIHKEYLQSKLNDLGGKLKSIATGDFSNFQLVNSVGGAINQIAKDPVIQNAVYSSERIRQGQNEMETARQEGKSSPQNEAFWNKQINDWENDGDLNTKFNGNYISYTDVGKKLREVADKIHEVDSSIDNPFQIDAQGNVIRDEKTGQPLINDTLLRTKIKGKPAEKILGAFMDSLDETDQRQLHIDSWYHYRGATKDTFKNDIVNNYNNQKKMLTETQSDIALELKTNTKLTSLEKEQYQAKLNNINKTLESGELETALNREIKGIENENEDSLKYRLYTGKYLSNLAQDLSYQSYSQEILSNPYKQVDLDTKRLQLAYESERFREMDANRRFGLDMLKYQTELEKEGNKKDFYGPAVSETVPFKEKELTLSNLDVDINGVKDQINQTNAKWAPYIGNKDWSVKQKQDYLDGLLSNYKTNPAFFNTLSPNEKAYLEERRQLDNQYTKKITLRNAAKKQGEPFQLQLEQVLGNEPTYKSSTGNNINASDIFEVKTTFANSISPSADGTPVVDYSFINKYPIGSEKREVADALIKSFNNIPLNYNEKNILNKSTEIGRKYLEQGKQVLQQRVTAENEYLVQHTPTIQRKIASIEITPASKNAIGNFVTNKLNQFYEHKKDASGGFDFGENFDPTTIQNFVGNKNYTGKTQSLTSYSIERNDDGTGKLILMNGGRRQEVPINVSEMNTFFPEVSMRNPFDEAIELATFSPNKTTNLNSGDGVGNATTAYLSGVSPLIPNLNNTPYAGIMRFDIEGHPFNDGSENDRFLLRGWGFNNGSWTTGVISNDYSTITGIQRMLGQFGPRTAEDFFQKYKK